MIINLLLTLLNKIVLFKNYGFYFYDDLSLFKMYTMSYTK